MKKVMICSLAVSFVLLLSFASFPMGGGAPEEQPAPEPEKVIPAEPTKEVASEELNKAKGEIDVLETKLDKSENYLDVLTKKMAVAKKNKKTAKLAQLQKMEKKEADHARALRDKIKKIKDKYPQLADYQPTIEAVAAEITGEMLAGKPNTQIKQNPSAAKIVYHKVKAGDSLMSISRKYFNTPSLYKEIAKMNGISGNTQLKVGMKLKIDMSLKSKIKTNL